MPPPLLLLLLLLPPRRSRSSLTLITLPSVPSLSSFPLFLPFVPALQRVLLFYNKVVYLTSLFLPLSPPSPFPLFLLFLFSSTLSYFLSLAFSESKRGKGVRGSSQVRLVKYRSRARSQKNCDMPHPRGSGFAPIIPELDFHSDFPTYQVHCDFKAWLIPVVESMCVDVY